MPVNCCIKNNPGLPELQLAPAEIADLDALLLIESRSFSSPWTRQQFLSEFQQPYAFVLVVRKPGLKTILGYIVYWLLFDELHILNLAVSPEARRQGIGRTLVEKTLKTAKSRQCQSAWLEVRPSNLAAIALYQSQGFEAVMTRKRYYSDTGEDALIYWRSLEVESDQ